MRAVPVQRVRPGKKTYSPAPGHRVRLQLAQYAGKSCWPGWRERRPELRRGHVYTPAWQERITGVPRAQAISVARVRHADKTRQVDGDHRRGDEPLVPLDMNLPRHHQQVMTSASIGQRGRGAPWPGESCARRPAGRRWHSRSTGSARRASRTAPASSTPTPTSGATRSWRRRGAVAAGGPMQVSAAA